MFLSKFLPLWGGSSYCDTSLMDTHVFATHLATLFVFYVPPNVVCLYFCLFFVLFFNLRFICWFVFYCFIANLFVTVVVPINCCVWPVLLLVLSLCRAMRLLFYSNKRSEKRERESEWDKLPLFRERWGTFGEFAFLKANKSNKHQQRQTYDKIIILHGFFVVRFSCKSVYL